MFFDLNLAQLKQYYYQQIFQKVSSKNCCQKMSITSIKTALKLVKKYCFNYCQKFFKRKLFSPPKPND